MSDPHAELVDVTPHGSSESHYLETVTCDNCRQPVTISTHPVEIIDRDCDCPYDHLGPIPQGYSDPGDET
jgi:hypothetical protein